MTEHDYRKAIAMWEQCCRLYYELNDTTRIAQCYDQLGYCYFNLGQHDKADEMDALMLQTIEQSANQIALCYHLLTHVNDLIPKNNFAEALEISERVLAISREMGAVDIESSALLYMGRIAYVTGYFDKCYQYFDESLQVALMTEGSQSVGMAYAGLARASVMLENYEEGRDYSQKAYDLLVDTQPYVAVMVQFGMSLAYCGLEDYISARTYLTNPIHLIQATRSTSTILYICISVAIIYAHSGDSERGIELLSLTLTHPMSDTGWKENWGLLIRLRANLEAELGTERYQQAWNRGTQLDPDEVLDDLVRWIEDGNENDDLLSE